VFHFGSPGPQDSDEISIVGTWDAYSTMRRMERVAPGTFVAKVVLGETRSEQFRLVLNKDNGQALHPDRSSAGQDGEVLGPNAQGAGKSWLINGKAEDVPAWTVFEVTLDWRFSWEHGEQKRVTWSATDLVVPAATRAASRRLVYSVVGSWTSWKFQAMAPSTEEGVWSTTMRIGLTGREEFQFSRDNDWSQVIHPAIARARKVSIPIHGPDHFGNGKTWLLLGSPGDTYGIQLRVVDGDVTVTTTSKTNEVNVWRSTEEDNWMEYYFPARGTIGVSAA